MKKVELLTKEDIARELSDDPKNPLSVRSVERYIHLAQIEPAVKGSGRGKQAKYRGEDVEKIKAAYREAAQRREQQSTALATTKPTSLASRGLTQSAFAQAGEAIADAVGRAIHERFNVPVDSKLTLKLDEAAALAGLSRNFLLNAIKADKLKASKRGRGWNIKRDDLNLFVKKL